MTRCSDRPSPTALARELNKKFEGSVVQLASDSDDAKIVRRPTGIASLDIGLGGGFPGGTICAISGKESAGKDALLNRIIRTHQRIYGDEASIFYAATEAGGFDKLWARAHGVKVALSKEEIDDYEAACGFDFDDETRARFKEQIGSFILMPSSSAEEVFTSMLRYADTGAAHLLICNSVSALLPDIDLENPDVGQNSGEGLRQAKLVTDFTKKWGKVFTGKDGKDSVRPWYPTALFTQQARANIGGARSFAYKPTTTNTGAHALRHAKSIDVELVYTEKIKTGEEVVGKKIRWTLVKGKHGTHDGITNMYELFFSSGPDENEDLVAALCTHDFLKLARDGTVSAIKDWDRFKVGERFQKPEIINLFRSDPDLFRTSYQAVLKAAVKAPYLVKERI